ncbi:GNAT family N-acetyltransferase [Chloroflexota bacterium]
MQGKIKIRKGTRDDASAVHELHTMSAWQLCKDDYSDAQLHGWLDHRTPEGYFPAIDQGRLFVAIEGSVIVGFGEAVPGEILAIYVSPDHVKKGIGTILLEHGMEISRSGSSGVVLDASLNSVGFYLKSGFAEVQKKSIRRGNIALPCILMEYTVTP